MNRRTPAKTTVACTRQAALADNLEALANLQRRGCVWSSAPPIPGERRVGECWFSVPPDGNRRRIRQQDLGKSVSEGALWRFSRVRRPQLSASVLQDRRASAPVDGRGRGTSEASGFVMSCNAAGKAPAATCHTRQGGRHGWSERRIAAAGLPGRTPAVEAADESAVRSG